jgi:flagellar basal body-associated protein FliL
MDIIDAAVQRDIVLLLAVIVVALAGAVGFLFRLLIKEKDARVKRSEELTDKQGALFDSLEESTKQAVAVAQANAEVAAKAANLAQASLDELRKR